LLARNARFEIFKNQGLGKEKKGKREKRKEKKREDRGDRVEKHTLCKLSLASHTYIPCHNIVQVMRCD
jgi:uncharacterized protein (UPF0248 family)